MKGIETTQVSLLRIGRLSFVHWFLRVLILFLQVSYNYNWNKDENLNTQKYAITIRTFDKEINYQHKANYKVTLIKCVF